MKKLLSSLLALMMVFSLSACGASQAKAGQSDPDLAKAKETVENYYKAIQSGELDSLQDYCTEQYAKDNEFEELSNQVSDLTTSLPAGLDVQTDIEDLMQTLLKNIVRDYKITNISKKDEKIKVKVTSEGIDPDKMDTNSPINDLLPKYEERMNAVSTEEEQYAILTELIKEYVQTLKDNVNNMESVETKSRLTLVKEEDEWLIDKLVQLDE